MSSDEDGLFSAAMTDVVPLKREKRAALTPNPARERDTSLDHRRRAAQEFPATDRNTLSDTTIEPLDPWYVVAWKRPGVQNGVFRKLKQGRYELQSRLDLHRMTVETARRRVFEFFEEVHDCGLRSVLLIHGKGESRAQQERSSILKGCVNHWLRELDVVLAFHSAQPRHGGTGAVYVLLRKSEAEKRENREKFAKGRVVTDP